MTLGSLSRKPCLRPALLRNTDRLSSWRIFGGLALLFLHLSWVNAQEQGSNVVAVSIENDHDFSGFELLDVQKKRLFVLAEHWHNIKMVPQATLKVLRYLHENANVRILAIEHGKSVAFMINEYLETGDEQMLQHITRNTMFWGMENRAFFKDLRSFNQALPREERVMVQSIDIEYKQEAAIFMINQFIGAKEIPNELSSTVGEFKRIYEESKAHRESYDGLAIMYYYDRDFVQQLVIQTINELEDESDKYIKYFGEDFSNFATMILEMDDGLTFDYTNPNQHYRFRDRLIYRNFVELTQANPEVGILCPIGMRHMMKNSSLSDLNIRPSSPLKDQVSYIRVSALYKKSINAGDLKKVNFNFPNQLKVDAATLIKHDNRISALKSGKGFDYTLFINDTGNLTPFENTLTEQY